MPKTTGTFAEGDRVLLDGRLTQVLGVTPTGRVLTGLGWADGKPLVRAPRLHRPTRKEEAFRAGKVAARENLPVEANPYPFDTNERRAWEFGWRSVMPEEAQL
jgi:hypothetical protein